MYYNPSLGIVCLALIAIALVRHQWTLAGARAIHLSAGLIIAYGLMFIDNSLAIWERLGLDYSTHTAVAVILTAYLAIHMRQIALLWLISLVGYFGFMMYKGYHTLPDIVTTTVVVIVPLLLVIRYVNSFKPLRVPSYKILTPAESH